LKIKEYTRLLLLCAGQLALNAAVAHADPVVLQLRWDHQFQFAGYYAALWQGYYSEEGIDVEIKPGVTPDYKILSATEEVAAGRADFGIGASDILIANDAGAGLTVTASFFQHSPVGIFTRAGDEIRSPADLKQATLLGVSSDFPDAELKAMLMAEGIDARSLEIRELQEGHRRSIQLLANRTIDAYAGYTLTAMWQARAMGMKLHVLRPIAYGIDFYGDSLFTTTKLASQNPDLVARFIRASKRGWEYALYNPQEIIKKIVAELPRRFNVDDPAAFNNFQYEQILDLIHYQVIPIGQTHTERWRHMHEILLAAGAVSGSFDTRSTVFDPIGEERISQEKVKRLLIMLLSGISLMLGIAISFGYLLRKQVVRRTKELAEKTETLKDSEKRYRALVEGQPDLICRFTPDGALLYANDAYCRFFGLNPGQVFGSKFSKFIPGGYQSAVDAHFAAFSETHPTLSQEHEVIAGSGDRLWMQWKNTAIFDDSGQIKEFVSIGRDVTENKQITDALRESERRLVEAQELAQLGSWELRHADDRLIWSDQTCRIFEVDCNKALNTLELFWSYVHPDDWIELKAAFQNRLTDGEPYEVVHRIRMPDGRVKWLAERAQTTYDGLDVPIATRGTVQDITERKLMEDELRESEARYRRILEIAPEAIIVTDKEMKIQIFNRGAEQIFSYSANEIRGQSLGKIVPKYHDLLHSAYPTEGNNNLGRAPGSQSSSLEVGALRKSGKEFPARASVTRSDNDGQQFFTLILRDVSDEKKLGIALRERRKLRKAKEEAEEANREKSKFLAAASHDLRQPLQAMGLFLSLLNSKLESGAAQDDDAIPNLLERMRESVDALNSQFSALLDISKLDAGTVTPELAVFNVDEVTQLIARQFEPQAEAKGLRINVLKGHTYIKSDKALLSCILSNLVSNAIRYTDDGSVHIVSHKSDSNITIDVMDTGIGIAQDQIDIIFNEYYQIDRKRRDRNQGLGLGLAISKRMADLLDISLTVRSRQNKGSTFRLTLPAVQVPSQGMADNDVDTSLMSNRAGQLSILLIEDQLMVLESLEMLLEVWGFEVMPANSFENATDLLERHAKAPDLIISDLQLADDVDGIHVIEHFRVLTRNSIPGIIITGDTSPERLRVVEMGGVTVLNKPVTPEGLLHAINTVQQSAPA